MNSNPAFSAMKGRGLFLVTMIWLAVPLFMWRSNVLIHQSAVHEVVLEVRPVDPHDLFRGAYVILNYDFSQIDRAQVKGADAGFRKRQKIYAVLVPRPDSDVWDFQSVSPHVPQGQVFIEGRVKEAGPSFLRTEFGIESYFAPEQRAKEYEEANRAKKLFVRVKLTPAGRPAIQALEVRDKT